MQAGKFIVFEGIDGAGKTTQLKKLEQHLQQENISFYLTKEPTDGPIGSLIRNVLNKRIQLDERTMAALFLADRLDHIQNPINGMLQAQQAGKLVISDRYYLSSYAYHSAYVPMDWVISANSECAKLMRPDIIFFLNISPEASLERIRKTRAFLDLYETKDRLTQVRSNYYKAIDAVKAKENVIILDATKSEEQLFQQIWRHIAKSL
jgi:dTMP kinase